MGYTFVFPDLHGRLDHFRAAVAAVETYDTGGSAKTMIFLGDYIDRGPESAQLVAELRAFAKDKPNVICLSGNHEYMMLWGLAEGDEALICWLMNGGNQTVDSYRDADGNLDEEIMAADIQWFSELPFMARDECRVYVHAGVDPDKAFDDQSVTDNHWKRYEKLDGRGFEGKHVVHGHTPDPHGPITIGNRTCMDVGAVFTGRYVVGLFEDGVPGGPIGVIEVS